MLKEIIQLKKALASIKEANHALEGGPGKIPSFEWLWEGNLARWERDNYESGYNGSSVLESFIELNSDILSRFDVKRFLGHGAIADAWLLEDDRVLKIFDADSKNDISLGLDTEYDNYRQKVKELHEGLSDSSDPMIYELGKFRVNQTLQESTFDGPFTSTGSFSPAYVVTEKVDAMFDLMDVNTEDINYEFPFTLEDILSVGISVDNYNRMLKGQSNKAGLFHIIISRSINNLLNFVKGEFTKYDNMYSNKESKYDFDDSESIEQFIQDMTSKIKSETLFGVGSIPMKAGSILGMNDNWIYELVKSALEQLLHDRSDLHIGNFGLRNGKIVFYDS